MLKLLLYSILSFRGNLLELPYYSLCSCSEYTIDLCSSMFYCSWDGQSCIDLDCSLQLQYNCVPEDTMYKCQWDYLTNKCIYAPYTCNQIQNQKFCTFKKYHGLGQCCMVNDYNKCSAYDAVVNCPQLTDFKSICVKKDSFCVWENNACRNKVCEDVIIEHDCYFIRNIQNDSNLVCFWTGTRCRTASNEDIENFSLYQCERNTQYAYKWEDSKCQKCSQFAQIAYFGLFLIILIEL